MTEVEAHLQKYLAKRDIENADRAIERLCSQIRLLEGQIKEQEAIRRDAEKRLAAHD